jgi:hypothetical protein
MPEGHIKFFPLDLDRRSAEFKPGIVVDLQLLPGLSRSASIRGIPRRARAA